MNTVVAIKKSIPDDRIKKLIDELNYALKKTDRQTLVKWGTESAGIFVSSLKRRGFGFVNTIRGLATGVAKESVKAALAAKEGNFRKHFADRTVDATVAIGKTKDKLIENIKTIANRVKKEPTTAAPELLVAVIGFYLGSGGLDGDGGIPDLDLEMGIGSHRSIWFHSIIPGATIEAAVFSLATLADSIHGNLPESHDKLWDRLITEYNRLSLAFASGTCAGLAYHLIVDATWDSGKAYSDLPFSTPMAGHQTIMGVNAAAEVTDINKKSTIVAKFKTALGRKCGAKKADYNDNPNSI